MDAVEHSQESTASPDGRQIRELLPLRRRRFVLRAEFAARSRGAAAIDLDAFRADQSVAAKQDVASPYES